MKVFKIRGHADLPLFGYRDAYNDKTLFVRIKDVLIVCTIDDLGACKYYLENFQSILGDEIDFLESLAVVNEYEMAARRLYGKWLHVIECDLKTGAVTLEGEVREPIGVRPCDENLEGKACPIN